MRTGRFLALPCFLAACCLLLAAPAAASPGVRVSATAAGYLSADVEDGPGEVSILATSASLGVSWFTLSYGQLDFSWDDTAALPFGNGVSDPWDRLHSLSFSARHRTSLSDGMGIFYGGFVGTAFEDSSNRSVYGGARAGLSYNFQGFRTTAGLTVYYDGIDWGAFPLLGVSVGPGRVGDEAAAGGGGERDVTGFSASVGFPSTYVGYRFSRLVGLRVAGTWWQPTYALADDSPVVPDGYVSMRNVNAGLYLDLYPVDGMSVTVGGHYVFYREFSFYNGDGDLLADFDVDNAAAVSVNVSYNF